MAAGVNKLHLPLVAQLTRLHYHVAGVRAVIRGFPATKVFIDYLNSLRGKDLGQTIWGGGPGLL